MFSTIKPFSERYYRWKILLWQAFQTSLWCQNPFLCLLCKRFTCPTQMKLWKKINSKIWRLLYTGLSSLSVNIGLLHSFVLSWIRQNKSWSKDIVWANPMHSVLNLPIDKKGERGENNTATNIFLYTVCISIQIKWMSS